MASFVSGNNYLLLPRDPQMWVIKDLIPVGGLTNIYGKPKTGKSYAALGMADAISNGKSHWLEFEVRKHGPVAYLQIDTPRSLWALRLSQLRTAGYTIDNMMLADMLMAPYPYNVLDAQHQTWLAKEIAELKPVVVFIDTLREAHNGDENDSTVMRNVITNIVSACRWKEPDGSVQSSAVVLISHGRKDNMFTAAGGDDLMSDARGSSYVAGRMDTVIRLGGVTMQYQGRSVGLHTIGVVREEDTGMVMLDQKGTAYRQLLAGIVDRMVEEAKQAGERLNHSEVTRVIQEKMDASYTRSERSIKNDIKDYLEAKELAERT